MDEREALKAEVEALQLKLHQLHATDVNTYRRSYATIAQHVEALKVEATRLEALVQEVEPDIYTPDFVAEEFGKAAVVGGAGWVLYKIVKSIPPIPPKAKSWLGGGLFVATAVVISWRFASSSIGRFASAFLHHRRRKKAFLRELEVLQHRIDILQAITSSLPHAVSQPNLLSAAAAGAPAASSPAAAGSAAASRSGSGGNGGREQFVVLDLPRVESGGFFMPSPVPSPPPAMLATAAMQSASDSLGALGMGLYPSVPAAAAGGPGPAAGSSGAGRSSSSGTGVQPGQQAATVGPFATAAVQQGGGAAAAGVSAPGAVLSADQTCGAKPGSSESQHRPGGAELFLAAQEVPAAAAAAGAAAEQSSSLLQEHEQQEEGQEEEAGSFGSRGGFEIPDSVMKAGWGGVKQQQQQPWQPLPSYPYIHPLYQQQQQQQQQRGVLPEPQSTALPSQQQYQAAGLIGFTASPASRQWSQGTSGTLGEDDGEFVEQPSDPEKSDPEDQASSSSRVPAGLQPPPAAAAGASSSGEDTAAGRQPVLNLGTLQRGSAGSSSDEDAVLLERE